MSIKDVSSMASLRAMPATRQETIHAMTGKNVDPVDSFEVSLSPEAMAQARDNSTPPTQEERDASAREVLNLRNQAIARMPTGPSLASDFYTDPATANDAVSFQAFFQNATVSADEMADALHKALTSPTQNGDYTTNAQLAEGTHPSQKIRNEMLSLTASTTDSEAWFSSINNWVEQNRSLPYILEIEKGHISALHEQWQSFVADLKTDV